MEKVTVTFELQDDVAMALAQFCKRSTFETFRSCAESDDEANRMIRAITALQKALAEEGYAPRRLPHGTAHLCGGTR